MVVFLATLAGTASAATTATSLSVSAIVVAYCSIAPELTANTQAALISGPAMCKSPMWNGIAARRPQIFVEQDAAVDVTRLVLAF